ncbi:tetratricopeptide repeat protein [Candidatus Dependentiae bacterium]|nr:tetratricopeptide repeat protein [Candidatus Dependentiae bacterium]
MKLIPLVTEEKLAKKLTKQFETSTCNELNSFIKLNILYNILYLTTDYSSIPFKKYLNMFEKLRKNIEIPEINAKFKIHEYHYNSSLGNFEKLSNVLSKLEVLHKKTKSRGIYFAYIQLKASYYAYRNNQDLQRYKKAEALFKEGIKLALKRNDPTDQFKALSNLMAFYINQERINEAEQLSNQILEIKNLEFQEHYHSRLFNNFGVIYFKKRDFKKSLKYFMKAYKLARKINDYKAQKLYLGNIAGIYFQNKEYKKAIEIYKDLIKSFKRASFFRNKIIWLKNLGICYINLKKYNFALRSYQKLLRYAQENNHFDYIKEGYKLICYVYFRLKDVDQIKKYKKLALDLNKSHFGIINKEDILIYDFIISLLESSPDTHNKLIVKFRNKMKNSKDFNQCLSILNEFN